MDFWDIIVGIGGLWLILGGLGRFGAFLVGLNGFGSVWGIFVFLGGEILRVLGVSGWYWYIWEGGVGILVDLGELLWVESLGLGLRLGDVVWV